MSNLHPTFEAILKPHLQGQRIVKRRDLDRYKALSAVHAELELAGVTIDIGQLDWAVSEVQNRLHEASLDRQFAEQQAQKGDAYFVGTKCWANGCGHARGEHDKAGCRGGEDTICRCTDFVEPDDEQEAEREERRQYREWRNDSGV